MDQREWGRDEFERALADLESRPILDARTKVAGVLVVVLTMGLVAIAVYGFFQ